MSLERVFSKVHHFEGETLSVQCSYKGRKHHMEGKAWCKVRRKKCETGFPRAGVQGPRYLLQDDTRAKVVTITMAALRRQDSGRYWCMRNSSGTLYPLMSFLLEVSPGEQACRGAGTLGAGGWCPPHPHSAGFGYNKNKNPPTAMTYSGVFTVLSQTPS